MNPVMLRLVAVALLVGAVLVGWYGYAASREPARLPEVAPIQILVPQVVASRMIQRGTVLSESDLSIEQVANPSTGTFREKSDLIDKVTVVDIEENSAITSTKLKYLGPVAEYLKPGERGVAIKVDEVVGVGGYIRPGDHVDVLLYINADMSAKIPSSAQLLLRDLRVISYGEYLQEQVIHSSAGPEASKLNIAEAATPETDKKPAVISKSAVLAVSESEVTRLMLGASIGQLRLALRGPDLPSAQQPDKDDPLYLTAQQLQSPGARLSPSQKPQNTKPVIGPPRKNGTSQASVVIHAGDKTEVVNFGEHR